MFAQPAEAVYRNGQELRVRAADGTDLAARTVVLALGVVWRRLGVPSLERLVGAGVFYGAGGSEARAMRDQDVYVVGAGNSAGQAALNLAQHGARVVMVVRGRALAASMSSYLVEEIGNEGRIDVRVGCEVIAGSGSDRLASLTLRDNRTGTVETRPASALFVMIGGEPRTGWLHDIVQRDAWGYLLTGRDLLRDGRPPLGWPLDRPPLMLETSTPGIFAAGDVRHRSLKRVASAVGDGAMAVQLVHEYLGEVDGRPS